MSAPAAPAAPAVDPGIQQQKPSTSPGDDPQRIWAAVMALVAAKNALAWVRSLSLRRLEGQVAHVTALPGQREIGRFVNDRRREQLAELLKSVLGRAVRVQIDDASADASPQPAISESRPSPTAAQDTRRDAMQLPLVKQVLDIFDATPIAVHKREADADDHEAEGKA